MLEDRDYTEISYRVFSIGELNHFRAYGVEMAFPITKTRRAVEELFDVKVVRVNTANRKGKPRRTKYRWGRTKGWKKAIVKLHPEDKISFF